MELAELMAARAVKRAELAALPALPVLEQPSFRVEVCDDGGLEFFVGVGDDAESMFAIDAAEREVLQMWLADVFGKRA